MFNTIKKSGAYLRALVSKPRPAESRFRYKDILFFLRFAKPVQRLGIIGMGLIIVTSGIKALLPLSSKVLIDFIIMKEGFNKAESFLKSLHLAVFIEPVRYFLGSLNLMIMTAVESQIILI